jgi:hypothetical protein
MQSLTINQKKEKEKEKKVLWTWLLKFYILFEP